MKLGIITDIHSNKIALEAVLQEFKKRNVEKIICCGDIIGIGPFPEETVQILTGNKDRVIGVRGNHEQYLLEGLPEKVHDDKRRMEPEEIGNHKWNHSQISKISKEFLNELPEYKNIEIENKKIYITHYPKNENGEYKKNIKNPTIEENEKMFSGIDADIFLYGHTHATNIKHKDGKWYINVGTLGCPMSDNNANAGILTIDKEKVDFEHLSVKYNVEEVTQEIEKIKFPFYKQVLEIFYS